jgi:hypothetical protein
MKTPSLWMIAAACFIATASVANARSAYDGSWDLVFVTQTGLFDPSYNFTVDITDGVVTHPNLVRSKGYAAKPGSVRASVTAGQIRVRHRQALRDLRSRKMEWSRGNYAMHGLLDRPAQMTNLKSETPCSEPLTCERQLQTRSP